MSRSGPPLRFGRVEASSRTEFPLALPAQLWPLKLPQLPGSKLHQEGSRKRRRGGPSEHRGLPGHWRGVLSAAASVAAFTQLTWLVAGLGGTRRSGRQVCLRARRYQWEESGKDRRELHVYVPVGESVRSKHIDCHLTDQTIRVGINGSKPIIEDTLFSKIKVHESVWFLEQHCGRKCLAITLAKNDMWQSWDYLTLGEAARDRLQRQVWAVLSFFLLAAAVYWRSSLWSFVQRMGTLQQLLS